MSSAAADDTSWLDVTSTRDADSAVEDDADAWLSITSGVKLTNEHSRAPSMVRNALGRDRVWACDGEYVYFRRKKAHEGTLRRHAKFIETGDYTHVATQDDVEIYKLGPASPFKRQPVALNETQYPNVRRMAILAACAGDYGLYVDCLEELAGRLKGSFHEAMAKQVYEDELTHVSNMIAVRRGPTQGMIDAGVQAVRRRRGSGVNRVLVMPPPNRITV